MNDQPTILDDQDACISMSPDGALTLHFPNSADENAQVPEHVRIITALAILLRDEDFRDEVVQRAFAGVS